MVIDLQIKQEMMQELLTGTVRQHKMSTIGRGDPMAVLIEAISVVIRTDALLKKYPGGWNAFMKIVPNSTLCSDNELARVGFMTPQDVGAFVARLEQAGLVFLRSEKAVDLAIVDQLRGPTTPCDWLEFGHIEMGPGKVAACRLAGSQSTEILTPDGWKYEGSLSASHGFVPTEGIRKDLTYLRTENGIDVYLDKASGKEVYVGRTHSG